jgi:hypothetical protein
VLAVFETAGISLADLGGWEHRPEDTERFEAYLRYLEESIDPPDQEHIEYLRGETESLRVRPEDVAGACLEDDLPAGFYSCRENGIYILEQLDIRVQSPPSTNPQPEQDL